MTRARDLSLAVTIFVWATILGGIVYSHIVFFPPYLSALPDTAALVNGPHALHDEYFWITLHPLAILTLLVALVLNWKIKPRRNLIGLTIGMYVIAIVLTALYFVPELIAFRDSANSHVSAAELLARGQQWQHLSWLRGIWMFAAFVPLLLAWRRGADLH